MTLSQIASVLALDEVNAIRPVPLTDEELARVAARRPANRSARRAVGEHRTKKRKQRSVRNKAQVQG